MLLGSLDSAGRLLTTVAAPSGTSSYNGGVASAANGALHIVAATPSVFVNGFGVSHTGQLCTAAGGAIASYQGGLPFTSNGRLVTQENLTPGANDPFVGGIRVGPLGGVYTVTDTPPVNSLPVNTTLPAITGSGIVGTALTADPGAWSGYPAPTFAYQWKRGATNVGTNSNSYMLVTADFGQSMTCVVTATNSSGSVPATSNTITVIPEVTEMALGMNLGFVAAWTGALPFLNVCANMEQWILVSGTATFSQNQGLLTASDNTSQFRAFISNEGAGMPTGTYTILNPDGCNIAMGDYSGTSGYTTATQFTHAYTGGTGLVLAIWAKGNVTNSLGNIAIIIPNKLAAWQGGARFTDEFLAMQTAMKCSPLRMMDWSSQSNNIETEWTDRNLPTRISYRSNAADVNVVPYEVMIDLCNLLNVDIWVSVPSRATQNYVTQMAALFSARLNSGLKIWLELGNECWNTAIPWGDGTAWVANLDFTKRTATANPATNVFTLSNHGLANNSTINSYDTLQNKAIPVAPYWANSNGYSATVETIDANTFYLHEGPITGPLIDIPAGQINTIFTVPTEAGKVSNVNTNFSKLCLRNWDTFESVITPSRIIKLIGIQAANQTTITERLNYPGIISRVTYIHPSAYFGEDYWGSAVDIASGTLTPKYWSIYNCTIQVSVYLATATPDTSDLIAGTGAISFQSVTYTAGTGSYVTGTPVSGLTNGVSYKVYFVFKTQYDFMAVLQATMTPSATTSTVYIYDSYSNQAVRARYGGNQASTFIETVIPVSQGVPVVYYEGGTGTYESKPTQMSSWIDTWIASSQFADQLHTFINRTAVTAGKMFAYFSDVSYTTPFKLKATYNSAISPRETIYTNLKGVVAVPPRLTASDIVPPDIATEPAYPTVIATFPNAALTYTIVSGNTKNNYSIAGNVLSIVNGNNINWATPYSVKLQIEGTDGKTSVFFSVSFATGQSWYAIDALFVWDSVGTSNNAQMTPIIGNVIPLTAGAGATIASNLWDMGGTNTYYNGTAAISQPVTTNPSVVMQVIDRDNQANGYNYVLKFNDSGIRFYTEFNPATGFRAETLTGFKNFAATSPTGAHVYWAYFDPATKNLYAGYDQVSNGFAVITGNPSLGRDINVGNAQSNMKQGTIQFVNRAGLTLAQAMALVLKVQQHHGIP